jgi:hypothetical protein
MTMHVVAQQFATQLTITNRYKKILGLRENPNFKPYF